MSFLIGYCSDHQHLLEKNLFNKKALCLKYNKEFCRKFAILLTLVLDNTQGYMYNILPITEGILCRFHFSAMIFQQ